MILDVTFLSRRMLGGKSKRLLICAAMAGTLVAICATFATVMADAYDDVARGVAVAAGNLATAVAHDVDRNIELLDLSLQAASKSWVDPKVQALAPDLRNLVLFDNSAHAQDVGAIAIIDANGDLQARSRPSPKGMPSVSDRDFFRVHLSNNDVGLYVSKPFISAASHTWIVALSRRITNPDGSFGGVAAASLELAYLNKLYRGLDLGVDGTVVLFRIDGTVITRAPLNEDDINRNLSDTDSYQIIRSAPVGSVETASPLDGRRRIISFHRVGDLPLIQDVEVSADEAYAGWWRKTAIVGGILLALCLISLLLMLMLSAELTRRVAVEQQLARLATTDSLTGLANRRQFDTTLGVEWRRATREGLPLSLLMIDADHFKAINDVYGHLVGDDLLASFAVCIDRNINRPADLGSRYGGEEFAVLLPNTDTAGALVVADAIRNAVMVHTRPDGMEPDRVVTVSVGVASLVPRLGQTGQDLVAEADAALYRAKAEGRNRCCAAPPLAAADQRAAA